MSAVKNQKLIFDAQKINQKLIFDCGIKVPYFFFLSKTGYPSSNKHWVMGVVVFLGSLSAQRSINWTPVLLQL